MVSPAGVAEIPADVPAAFLAMIAVPEKAMLPSAAGRSPHLMRVLANVSGVARPTTARSAYSLPSALVADHPVRSDGCRAGNFGGPFFRRRLLSGRRRLFIRIASNRPQGRHRRGLQADRIALAVAGHLQDLGCDQSKLLIRCRPGQGSLGTFQRL